ncbi:MAG: hypothetical protein V4438_04405 [Patescibacteria group bacterium]
MKAKIKPKARNYSQALMEHDSLQRIKLLSLQSGCKNMVEFFRHVSFMNPSDISHFMEINVRDAKKWKGSNGIS